MKSLAASVFALVLLGTTAATAEVGAGVHIGNVGVGAHIGIADGHHRHHHCGSWGWRNHHHDRFCRRWEWR
jgi:hypothetical protein